MLKDHYCIFCPANFVAQLKLVKVGNLMKKVIFHLWDLNLQLSRPCVG